MTSPWTRIGGALGLFAVAVALGACGGDDTAGEATAGEQTTVPQASTEATGTTTLEEPTTTAPEGPPPPARIDVRFRNGAVVGGVERHRVAVDDRVVLTVRSDVEDEVHLHGYDLAADVTPGQPARIRFRATEPGRFVFEFEHRHIPIGTVVVR